VEMYELCIDEDEKQTPTYIKYKCNKCKYTTEIPYKLIKDVEEKTVKCKNCNNILEPTTILNQEKKDNLKQPV